MNRLLLGLSFLAFSCNSPKDYNGNTSKKPPIHSEGNVSLFIYFEDSHRFTLVVNDSLKYYTAHNQSSSEGPQNLIDVVPKPQKPMKFYLKIEDRDTTFYKDVRNTDSLVFELDLNKHFIVHNENEGVWYYD
ncbi:MAG: hypothetical protein EOP48_14325 [Sphingobacteriales bacterium]|nr:MAG: hypothetical protein EOP48_14325 [Sphingobacteriales bacterium]